MLFWLSSSTTREAQWRFRNPCSPFRRRLANEQRLVHLIDRIHSAKTLDTIFIELQGEILTFFDADRMTLYAVDPDKKELYSKFLALDAVKEIRVPISEQVGRRLRAR